MRGWGVLVLLTAAAPALAAPTGVRLHAGVEGGLSLGGKVLVETDAIRFAGGAFVVGGQVGLSSWFFADPAYTPQDLTFGGVDLGLRLAPMVGVVGRLARDRIRLGAHAWAGAVVRIQDTTVRDARHDLDLRQQHTAGFGALGLRVSLAATLTDRVGLCLDAQLPVYLTGAPPLPLGWLVDGPTVGLAVVVHLPGRGSPGE